MAGQQSPVVYPQSQAELILDDGIIWVVVPQTLLNEGIQKLLKGISGWMLQKEEREKPRFWPSLVLDTNSVVESCQLCNSASAPSADPNLRSPLFLVGADIFDRNGSRYLILVDSYSYFSWFENNILSDLSVPESASAKPTCPAVTDYHLSLTYFVFYFLISWSFVYFSCKGMCGTGIKGLMKFVSRKPKWGNRSLIPLVSEQWDSVDNSTSTGLTRPFSILETEMFT